MNFLKFSQQLIRTLNFQQTRTKIVIARTLFTAQTLDLTAFQTKRQQALHNVESTNTFKWELKSYLINKSELDPVQLKNAIEVLTYLLAASSDDVDLVKQSLYALGTIQDINDKTKRSLGNLVMQAIYSINMFEAAFDLYSDPTLTDFFGSFKCTFLCLDLLYKNEQFDKIIKIDSEKRQLLWSKKTNFSKFLDVLVIGACYKLNTADSLEYATKLWSNIELSSQFKRAVAFYAALALNQNKPYVAVQILQTMEPHFVCEQIKLLALANLGYVNEVNEFLLSWMTNERLLKHKISKDVLERIDERLKQDSTSDGKLQFQKVYNELTAKHYVTDETLDEVLDRPVSKRIGIRGTNRNGSSDHNEMRIADL